MKLLTKSIGRSANYYIVRTTQHTIIQMCITARCITLEIVSTKSRREVFKSRNKCVRVNAYKSNNNNNNHRVHKTHEPNLLPIRRQRAIPTKAEVSILRHLTVEQNFGPDEKKWFTTANM